MLQQLTAQDASFLYLETAETPVHVGGLSLVELPDGHRGSFYEDYKASIASRVRHIPFMHARLVELPFDIDHPFWVDAGTVDLDYHIRHLTAPSPGRMKDLEDLIALLHAQMLDRSRPLWEFYVIDGLESGQVAIYTKMHHAAMDGTASQTLIATMYDPTPTPRVLPEPAGRHAGAKDDASLTNIVRGIAAHVLRQEIRALELVPEILKAWNGIVLPNPTTLELAPVPRVPRSPKTIFNTGIGNQRVYAARTLPLRGYLEDKGALPKQPLTAMVPISLCPADSRAANQNGMYLCTLATDVTDPVQRLLAINGSSAAQKKRYERLRNVALPDFVSGIGGIVRRMVEAYGRSRLLEDALVFGNLVISNVPGPTIPLYIAGAKIVSMYPCSIPFHGAALNITVESYCDRLDFGLIACRRAVPDLATLADRLLESMAALERAVAPTARAEPEPPGSTVTRDPPKESSHVDRNGHHSSRRDPIASPPAPAGRALADREAEPAGRRPAEAPRGPSQGHRGPARRQRTRVRRHRGADA